MLNLTVYFIVRLNTLKFSCILQSDVSRKVQCTSLADLKICMLFPYLAMKVDQTYFVNTFYSELQSTGRVFNSWFVGLLNRVVKLVSEIYH